jgi:signal transduction histidine kinase
MMSGRVPLNSRGPIVGFAVVRLALALGALIAEAIAGFPDGASLAVPTAVAVVWAAGMLVLMIMQAKSAVSPLAPAGDFALLALIAALVPASYLPVRLVALFVIGVHAQVQGRGRALLVAVGAVVPLATVAALSNDVPFHGGRLAAYEALFAATALALSDLTGSSRTAESTERVRARDLARRTIEAEDGVRRRVAETIHDGPIQELVSLEMMLTAAAGAWSRGEPERATEILGEAQALVARNVETLRDEILGLGPYAFEELSIESALVACKPTWERRYEIAVDLRLARVELSPELAGGLFRIAQEAVTNAGRHAAATRVSIELTSSDGGVELHVTDDGRGFRDVEPLAVGDPGHIGLTSMRERAELMNGRLDIETGDEGTTVSVRAPLPDVATS